ncbi:MAG: hypothetical protein GEU95_23440 [Rhizobiales bacterium]|nr:hypothetical protein [Hyphomicrobiales bacterium]
MSVMDIPGRRTGHDKTERRQDVAALAVLLLASAALLSATKPTHAQVALDATFPGGLTGNDVCVAGNRELQISGDDTCDQTLNPVTGLRIGPAGSQTTFNGANGDASFGSTATFNSSATFNSASTFNAGMSATTGTFSGTVTMDGGLAVGAGQTVDMGGNRVQNVGGPVAGTDATNKNYVDALHNGQQTQINQHGVRLTGVETHNTQQDTRLTGVETVNTQQNTRLTALESGIAGQAEQITAINQSLKSLSKRDGELADGIAISLALAQPAFQPGQRFAIRGGWGNFDGSNAFGVSAAGLLHSFRNGGSVILDLGAGVSTKHSMFAGRGGVTLGW